MTRRRAARSARGREWTKREGPGFIERARRGPPNALCGSVMDACGSLPERHTTSGACHARACSPSTSFEARGNCTNSGMAAPRDDVTGGGEDDAASATLDPATLASRSAVAASRAALMRVRAMLRDDPAEFRIATPLAAPGGGSTTVSEFAFAYRARPRQSGARRRVPEAA